MALPVFDGFGQGRQCREGFIHRRSDRRGTITCHTMANQQPLNGRQALARTFHHVMSRPSMNVDVNHSRRKDGVTEVDGSGIRRKGNGIARPDRRNDPVLDHKRGIINALERSQQLPG